MGFCFREEWYRWARNFDPDAGSDRRPTGPLGPVVSPGVPARVLRSLWKATVLHLVQSTN